MVTGDEHRGAGIAETPIETQLEYAVDRIVQEPRGTFNPETVEKALRESYEELKEARVPNFVVLLAERRTRELLRALAN